MRKTRVVDTDRMPTVDAMTTGTQTTFSRDMLQGLPTARDPGSSSSRPRPSRWTARTRRQSGGPAGGYVSRGASSFINTWTLDGVDITDMSETGASPIYYDFDMLEEVQIVTGGADASQQTGA